MTPDQIKEAMRLASNYAMQRTYRAGLLRNAATAEDSVLVAQAHVRVKKAEKKLEDHLHQCSVDNFHMTARLAGALSDVLSIDGDAGSADKYARGQKTLDDYIESLRRKPKPTTADKGEQP